MRTGIRLFINLVITGTLVVLIQGCCLIGLTIGAVSDSKKPAYKTVEPSDSALVEENSKMITATVKRGEKITVITRDNQTIPGKFKGTTGENDDFALQISHSDSIITIPVKNVSKIQMRNWKYGALTGFLVGAVIDGVAIVIIAKSMEDMELMGSGWQ